MRCPLCSSESKEFFIQPERKYLECIFCKGIFVIKDHLPDIQAEKERYLTHNNNVNDPRYQKFVAPIVEAVIKDFNPKEHKGLDFGAGTGPVITKLLSEKNFEIVPYDPIFLPFPELLQKKYDFIVCCEVMEHFQNPEKEFELLKSMLKPQGKLFCMTHIYHEEIDFSTWYYKNDPTHIFIYQRETLEFIREKFQFREVKIKDRLVTFIT